MVVTAGASVRIWDDLFFNDLRFAFGFDFTFDGKADEEVRTFCVVESILVGAPAWNGPGLSPGLSFVTNATRFTLTSSSLISGSATLTGGTGTTFTSVSSSFPTADVPSPSFVVKSTDASKRSLEMSRHIPNEALACDIHTKKHIGNNYRNLRSPLSARY